MKWQSMSVALLVAFVAAGDARAGPPVEVHLEVHFLLGYVVRGSFKIVVVDSIKVGASALRPLKRLVFADDRHAA